MRRRTRNSSFATAWTWVVLLAYGLGGLLSDAHIASVEHVVCEAHGVLEHGQHGEHADGAAHHHHAEQGGDLPGSVVVALPSETTDDHEQCGLRLGRAGEATVALARPVCVSLVDRCDVVAISDLRAPPALVRYRIAPKQSPPV